MIIKVPNLKIPFKKKKQGFTIMEVLIVLVIAGTITGVALYNINNMLNTDKTVKQINILKNLNTSIQDYASVLPTTDITALTNNEIAKNHIYPNEYIKMNGSNAEISTVFGEPINFLPVGTDRYSVELNALPKYACNMIGSNLWRFSSTLLINSTTVKTTASTEEEVPYANIVTACSVGDSKITYTVPINRYVPLVKTNNTGTTAVNNPDLIPSIDKTMSGACPSNAILLDYGCGCPEEQMWTGQMCEDISTVKRLDGITLGSTIPTDASTATYEDIKNNNVSGTASQYQTNTGSYVPSFINNDVKSNLTRNDTVISNAPENGYCVGGTVLKESINADGDKVRTCENPVIKYEGPGNVVATETINGVNNGSRFITCINGTLDSGRCVMPDDTETNVEPTKINQPPTTLVVQPGGKGSTCQNGQKWSHTTNACECPIGTTVNSNNVCACPEGEFIQDVGPHPVLGDPYRELACKALPTS